MNISSTFPACALQRSLWPRCDVGRSPSFSICLLWTWHWKAHRKNEVLKKSLTRVSWKWRGKWCFIQFMTDRDNGRVIVHRHTNTDTVTTNIRPGFSRHTGERSPNETFCEEKVEHECWPGSVYRTHTHTHTLTHIHIQYTDSGSLAFVSFGGHRARPGTRKLMK